MKRTIIAIATVAATFGMSAASCEQLNPAVDQIIEVETEQTPGLTPAPCGLDGVPDLTGTCQYPQAVPTPAPQPPCTEGLCNTDRPAAQPEGIDGR